MTHVRSGSDAANRPGDRSAQPFAARDVINDVPAAVLLPARAANASGEGGISSAFDARGEPHPEAWRLPHRLPDPENALSNASFAAHVFRPSFS